ncbi:MAG: hypothetical protein CMJ49_12375 [Planctomycetaceae bacterium]|nr:hypothetical protein [Planctomycetaceae bacterium]
MSPDASSKPCPTRDQVDAWIDSIWQLVESTPCPAQLLQEEQGFTQSLGFRHAPGCQFVRFTPAGMSEFYGYWQPAHATPAPLLIHVPGYGAEVNAHPDLAAAGFNILHVNPLGYTTPAGADESKQRDDNWPVLPDTILTHGEAGYRHWLANAAMGARWALDQPQTHDHRISFFGSSQGGGGSLLLASMFKDRGARCVAADVPFLTDFKRALGRGAYELFSQMLSTVDDPDAAWHTTGLIDTLSHVHRLHLPVLLTAGGADGTCPPDTIEDLFAQLPGTRSYTFLEDVTHRYTTQFIPLAAAWFRLHA